MRRIPIRSSSSTTIPISAGFSDWRLKKLGMTFGKPKKEMTDWQSPNRNSALWPLVVLFMPGKERNEMFIRTLPVAGTHHATRLAGLLIGAGLLVSCATASPDTTPLQTHYIQIQDAVSPQRLNVHVDDEVRWQNLRSAPVRISLLSQLSGSGVSCRTGFSRFGSLDDTATIPPNGWLREPLLRPYGVNSI